jgi:hypothetical protein
VLGALFSPPSGTFEPMIDSSTIAVTKPPIERTRFDVHVSNDVFERTGTGKPRAFVTTRTHFARGPIS